jgi:hypothetical protein
MKFENTRVYNFENALRGMRNPLNSWAKSDSEFGILPADMVKEELILWRDPDNEYCEYAMIGPNDMDLARRLINGGTEHRKFLRQIFVSVDITAPLYWYKEFDTYKVATAANSTSTMHKIASAPITLDCFEIGDYEPDLVYHVSDLGECAVGDLVELILEHLELLRQKYLETKDKRYWKELIRWLPEGWNQTRTWTANYEVLRSMYHQREHHKLCEWSEDFCKWVESLPYAKELIID